MEHDLSNAHEDTMQKPHGRDRSSPSIGMGRASPEGRGGPDGRGGPTTTAVVRVWKRPFIEGIWMPLARYFRSGVGQMNAK